MIYVFRMNRKENAAAGAAAAGTAGPTTGE